MELLQVSCDEEELRVKIDTAIRNSNGVRANLYTSHMAFESILNDEISKFEGPCCTCVDMVVKELSEAVRLCIRQVSI